MKMLIVQLLKMSHLSIQHMFSCCLVRDHHCCGTAAAVPVGLCTAGVSECTASHTFLGTKWDLAKTMHPRWVQNISCQCPKVSAGPL